MTSSPNIKRIAYVTAILGITAALFFSYRRGLAVLMQSQTFPKPQERFRVQKPVSHSNTASDVRLTKWMEFSKQQHQLPACKRIPDVIGIGVKKCGTGAMLRFLSQHPLFEAPDVAETFFFSSSRYQKGLEYYKKLMPAANENQLIGEKTPAYFSAGDVIGRIKKSVPRAKLILSLCEPVGRAFSDFVHTRSDLVKRNNASTLADVFHQNALEFLRLFSDAKDTEEIPRIADQACMVKTSYCYFSKGIYHPRVVKWREAFNDSQLLVLNGDDWMTNPGQLLVEEQRFLGLPQMITSDDFVRHPDKGFFCINRWWNKVFRKRLKKVGEKEVVLTNGTNLFCLNFRGKGKTRGGTRTMHDKTKFLLTRFYSPYNLKLYEALNRTFDW